MNRSEIINKVKTRIDEVSSSDSLIIDVGIEDNKPIDEIIDEVLDGSILEILSSAPLHYLPIKKADITTSVNETDSVSVAGYSIIKNIATFELPSDFLRLARLKLDSWKDYICDFTDENSAIARRQRDIYLRATTELPVAVRRNNTIMAYSVPSSSANAVIEYVGNALFEGSQCVITDNKAIEAMLWRCAAKALIVIGRTNEVQICETKSAEALV